MYNLTKLDLLWKWVDELKKTVAENVKHLLPDTSTATTGQILKLTGENKAPSWADEYSYTPPAYSETEVNTGQKWIDGKDVFSITFSLTLASSTGANYLTQSFQIETLINWCSIVIDSENNIVTNNAIYCRTINNYPAYVISGSSIISKDAYITIYYTKPAPETRDDDTPEAPEELKETKTRKKTK